MPTNEMECPGIIFELQWKKKPEEKTASIGIWDKADASLDLMTFKSYLGQNLGTLDDISVAYVDSEGDEIPIDSECEFQEALKFARQRARRGLEIVLKIDNTTEVKGTPISTIKSKDKSANTTPVSKPKMKNVKQPGVHFAKLHKKSDSQEWFPAKCYCSSCYGRKVCESTAEKTYGTTAKTVEKEDTPPKWFKKYMHKFKHELVEEVTSQVIQSVKQTLKEEKKNGSHNASETDRLRVNKNAVGGVSAKKKKCSDEDSSDGTLNDQRDLKLLKKIEKLHKRGEKKFEKLDSKLEKLENKTKRLLEKKSQSKCRFEKAEKCAEATSATKNKLKKKCSDIPVATYLMDAALLEKSYKEIHVRPGEHFVKVWQIMNNGTLPWTDKTELRLAWGTPGLMFKETVVKCPPFEPGEKGPIFVNVQAPNYPGTFESYWHFYHMGERFGHWIDCAVIVGNGEMKLDTFEFCKKFHKQSENGENESVNCKLHASSNKALLEKIGNSKEVKEKILEMAELTQELHDLQRSFTQQNQEKEKVAQENVCEKHSAPTGDAHSANEADTAKDQIKENRRKIAANMEEIQKRLDDISLLHSPPDAKKILKMAFGDDFETTLGVTDGIEESDGPDDFSDLNQPSGKNIEPSEWQELQLHPEFYKTCAMLKENKVTNEQVDKKVNESNQFKDEEKKGNTNPFETYKKEFMQYMCEHKDEVDGLLMNLEDKEDQYFDTETSVNLNDNCSKEFGKIEKKMAHLLLEPCKKPISLETIPGYGESQDERNEKDPEYESDSDSELSVISVFSSSSESDDEGNFIVVTMPSTSDDGNCGMCKSAIEEPGLKSEEDKCEEKVMNTAAEEKKENIEHQKSESKTEFSNNTDDSVPSKTEEEGKGTDEKVDSDRIQVTDTEGRKIYAVDYEGHCIPVEYLIGDSDSNENRRNRVRFGEYDKPESKNKKMKCSSSSYKTRYYSSEMRRRAEEDRRPRTQYHFKSFQIPNSTYSTRFTRFGSGPNQNRQSNKFSYSCPSGASFASASANVGGCSFCRKCGDSDKSSRSFYFSEKGNERGTRGTGCSYQHSFSSSFPNVNVTGANGMRGPGWTPNESTCPPPVDILPNVFMNGAIHAASTAISTARSVINNIQSAFRPDGEGMTGGDKKDKKRSKVSEEAMFKLFEMGFKDFLMNGYLLERHSNDLSKVVEVLISMENVRQSLQPDANKN